MTEREEVLALVIQASKNLGNDYELPADDSFCDDEIEALAEVIRLAKDDQKQSMLASGWRQCAQGQGASQFCEQAEALAENVDTLRKELTNIVNIKPDAYDNDDAEFRRWAQSRCRYTLFNTDAPMKSVVILPKDYSND